MRLLAQLMLIGWGAVLAAHGQIAVAGEAEIDQGGLAQRHR